MGNCHIKSSLSPSPDGIVPGADLGITALPEPIWALFLNLLNMESILKWSIENSVPGAEGAQAKLVSRDTISELVQEELILTHDRTRRRWRNFSVLQMMQPS